MLVLTRKPNESIKIGNDVIVTITQITQGRVRIAIEAPPEVDIARTELLERKSE